jgi:hypothetical protein
MRGRWPFLAGVLCSFMAKKNGKDATVWMRAIAPHTYEGHKQDVGDVYLAHDDMVETIVQVLKFAVLDTPPKKAVRL